MAVRSIRALTLGRANISSCSASLEEPLSAEPRPLPPHPDDGVFLRRLCDRGQIQSALQALSCIHSPLSAATYHSLLQACIKSKCLALAEGARTHIASHRVPLHGFLGDYLVMALAKCGAVDEADSLASTLPRLSVFSWTSIISAYAENGDGFEALRAWQRMQEAGVDPDSFTFVGLFRACGAIPDIQQGKNLHALARCKGFVSNVFVGNALLGMYANCGSLPEAQDAFDEICWPTTASWNMLLSATLEQGQECKVLELYKQMEADQVEPDSFTFVSLFKACGSIPELTIGRDLHVHACRRGLVSNPFVGNTIVNMYKKCGALAEAEDAFEMLPSRDIVSWSCMLSAYVDHSEGEKALRLYRQMREEGVFCPDQVTLSTALQACCTLSEKADNCSAYHTETKQSWLEIGHTLHSEARRESMCTNILTATSLLNMYGKCGSFREAESVFSTLAPPDMVASNAMLSAYIENKEGEKALLFYNEMRKQGIPPNNITLVAVLQACGILGEKEEFFTAGRSSRVLALDIGRLLHIDICTLGLETQLPIANTLVSMYGKFCMPVDAESVFNALPERDIVTWNAVLGACRSSGQEEKMLHFYKRIREANLILDEVSYIYIIQACGEAESVESCKLAHFDVISSECEGHLAVATSLMSAYGSCAALQEAAIVFNDIFQPNVVAWNASIAGYATEGNVRASLRMLEQMSCACVRPDAVSLTSILSACSHSGLVVEGLKYFKSMCVAHVITPEHTHFKLLVDLLGRSEDFKRIELLLQRMSMRADFIIWGCVLDACCTRGNFELGEQALDHVLSLKLRGECNAI